MSKKSPPPDDDKGYLANVVTFEDRLIELQESLFAASRNARQIHDLSMGEEEEKDMADEYSLLASFTGMLAYAARKAEAEVSETGASLQKRPPLSEMLRRQLAVGMDRMLIEEAQTQSGYDEDKADLAKQIEVFVDKLRDQYKLAKPRGR